MSKRFDATLKDLAAIDPGAFLAELDAAPTLPVRLLNVDLSTVTAATDIVFGLGDPLQAIIHVESQAGPDANKHLDLLAYHALLHRQYRVPVHSILLLLHRKAQLNVQTDSIQYAVRPGRGKMDFGYEVLRLWERPVEAVLAGSLGTLTTGMPWTFRRHNRANPCAHRTGRQQRLSRQGRRAAAPVRGRRHPGGGGA